MPNGERKHGATFALENIGWIDFETWSPVDIKQAGATAYAVQASAIVLAWAIGDGAVHRCAVKRFDGAPLWWADLPRQFQQHHYRVTQGEAIWAAWNAGFDKAIWNYSTLGFPQLEPHHVIDVMVQATASGFPPDLAMAAKFSKSQHKVASGKHLINLFCGPGVRVAGSKELIHGTPQSHPEEWREFIDDYAPGDIVAMRSVFLGTRQLPLAEWQEYWAMEAVNDRGVAIDLPLVEAAAHLADEDKVRSRRLLSDLTGGVVDSVDKVACMVQWLLERLPAGGREILTRREEEVDEETGEVTKPAKFSLTRKRVERLIAYCTDLQATQSPQGQMALDVILELLQIRLYGGSKTPAKFGKMIRQQVDGLLYGQYVFGGAAQTGRASSRGVQVHNLARDPLAYEPEAIDAVLAGADYRNFAILGDGAPVSRKLSLLIRPAFVPRDQNVFVWSDWSQIEARIVPWLCDHSEGAKARLQVFRDVDADPSLPDLYTRSAADISHIPIEEVTKAIRQRGKVAELALGFGGGVNALQAMGASYGLHLDNEEARTIVDRWRAANNWAVEYGHELWNAMLTAHDSPGKLVPAGRVAFFFDAGYFGGSLLIRLPSGRLLTYRAMRWERVDVLDDDDKPTGEQRVEMTFARGYGRIKLWPGIFVENVTQAVAADCLRGTLLILENETADWMPTRLHTHDEILVETTVGEAEEAAWMLGKIMRRGFAWSEDLPLISEETIAYYYTKHEESHGL